MGMTKTSLSKKGINITNVLNSYTKRPYLQFALPRNQKPNKFVIALEITFILTVIMDYVKRKKNRLPITKRAQLGFTKYYKTAF